MRINLKTIHIISKFFVDAKDHRDYICGVNVSWREDGLVYSATNGMIAIMFKDKSIDDEEKFEDFFIPNSYIIGLKFGSKENGIGQITFNKINNIDKELTIEYNNQTTIVESKPSTQFPDIQRILPENGYELVHAKFDIKYLTNIERFAKAMKLSSPSIAPNGNNPAYIDFRVDNIVAAVMPIRGDNPRTSFEKL